MGDEEDDDESAPTKYNFSAESKLDEDHLFLLQFTNNFISNVSRPRDFDHCTRWLEKLAGEPMYGVEAKRNRNMFLAMLLIAMQDNKVKGPFSTFPPQGTLPHAGNAFNLTPDSEQFHDLNLAMDMPERELNMSDYKHLSKDGRTYIATCALPHGGGCMSYVGVSVGGGEGLWLNRDGNQVPLNEVCGTASLPVVDPETPVKKQIEMVTSYKWFEGVETPDDVTPFTYLYKLPDRRSDTNIIEMKSMRKMSPMSKNVLLEVYPEEFVTMLLRLFEKSNESYEKVAREQHRKIVEQIYEEYHKEVERNLKDYKLARKEWQMVMNVIQNMRYVESEMAKQNFEVAESGGGTSKILSDAYNEAMRRKRTGYQKSQNLDSVIKEIHADIHGRLLEQKKQLGALEARANNMFCEIKDMRTESKRKKMVVQSIIEELNVRHPNLKPKPRPKSSPASQQQQPRLARSCCVDNEAPQPPQSPNRRLSFKQ